MNSLSSLCHPCRRELIDTVELSGCSTHWIGQDSSYKFYEVILVDPQHKAIHRDPRIHWICYLVHKHREMRGLTAEGKKNRGIRKGHRCNKVKGGSR